MDSRLQKIVDETNQRFGLAQYLLETWELRKRFDEKGKRSYVFIMEWFPKHETERIDEEINPDGTALIEYMILEKRYSSVVFDQGKSFSTKKIFNSGTREEAANWVQRETGLIVGEDIRLSEIQPNGFQFQSDVAGIDLSPGVVIDVKFDEEGRLTFYNIHGTALLKDEIIEEPFSMTLEEIEPIVKQQLQLVKLPSEERKELIPVYAMEEVYITVADKREIPFFVHERSELKVDVRFEWEHPSSKVLTKEELFFNSEVSVDEVFSNGTELSVLQLSENDIAQLLMVTKEVVCITYPNDSGKWEVDTISREENFIQVKCKLVEEDGTGFKRRFVVFINPENFTLLNYMDNEGLMAIFDTFDAAEKEVVTHEEAYEKMIPFITLDPTYVYDPRIRKYVLCGLVDSADCVHAVTGEIISLQDI